MMNGNAPVNIDPRTPASGHSGGFATLCRLIGESGH